MKIEFYDLENKTTLRHSSDFSLQEIPKPSDAADALAIAACHAHRAPRGMDNRQNT